mgnify:CR=1 FL=1|tara:strand:+ start:692 stop:2578 length:1887 start_codon:yes stop_codon:yes gene_type:complete
MKYKLLLTLVLLISIPRFAVAQWNWGEVERADTSLPSYFFDQQLLEAMVLAEVDGSVFPSYEEDYAKEISKFPKKLREDSIIIQGWTYWENQLKTIVDEIASFSEVKREYAILILDDASHNAFVTEGGLVMVTAGLLADIESLDELRLILAHEIGHVNHQHPYLAYARMRKAQLLDNIAVVASAYLVGVIWIRYTSSESIFIKRYNHKREHEDVADDFAIRYMKENQHSLARGLRFYGLLNRDIEKFKYATGQSPGHVLYCSAHSEPIERASGVVRKDDVIENSDEFIEMRNVARIRKLEILNMTKSYRETIDVGWHYLLKDNRDIKKLMLLALDALRFERTANFVFGRVLSDGYIINDELKSQIAQVDMSSDGAKNLVRSILKMTDSKGNTLFPLNITFSQMRDTILKDLYPPTKLEEVFRLKVLNNEADDKFLNSYIESGGSYQSYAKHLQDSGKYPLYRAACIPIVLEIDRYTLDMNYQKAFESADWTILQKITEEDFESVDLISIEDESIIDSTAAKELSALNSMFRFTVGANEMEFSARQLHPAIMDFACFYDLKELFLFTFYENSKVAFSQVLYLNLYDEKVKQTLFRKVPMAKDSEKYIPKRLAPVYKGALHSQSYPYEVK